MDIEYTLIEKDKLDSLNKLIRDLLWDFDRLSTSGQETLHTIIQLLEADECSDNEELNWLENIISAELKKTKVN